MVGRVLLPKVLPARRGRVPGIGSSGSLTGTCPRGCRGVRRRRLAKGDHYACVVTSAGAEVLARSRNDEAVIGRLIDDAACTARWRVDLARCEPMLIRRVPNLVPIAGVTGSAHCAVRSLEGPRDHRVAPPTRCAAPPNRPTRAHRHRPDLARSDRGRATATEPNRVAGHPRHTVALAPPPHRPTLDPTTATAGPTIDLSRDSPTHTAPRSRQSDLGLPPHPRRTRRARPPPRCVHGLADPQQRPMTTSSA